MHLSNLVLKTALILCMGMTMQMPAHAAAAKGEFGVKGIGASDCATAVREYKGGTPNAMMYGGWLYGYITALNQTTPDTFDVVAWQDLNTLSNFVVEYCSKNPKVSFAQAVFNMTAALKPKRLKTVSSPVRISRNGKSFMMYGEVINRMAQALAAKGYFKGSIGAPPSFSDELARALLQFQTKSSLPPTGEPDQVTLFRLFNG